MNAFQEKIDAYLNGVRALSDAVADMTREQVRARPVPGKWSTLEVLCHLADFEPIYAARMKRVIALDRPSLLGADENRFAAGLAYLERDAGEEMAVIASTRRQTARILHTLPTAAFAREGVHNEYGPVTLEQLLEKATNHVAHHLKFVLEKRRALGLSV
jgi:uncharacterized damage-inducible protein DinB